MWLRRRLSRRNCCSRAEFGLYVTVDGGRSGCSSRGMPLAQVRDLQLQKRETDVVMAMPAAASGSWTTTRRCAK